LLRDVIFEPHTWVTATRADLDHVLRRAVSDWLAASWPFQNPDYAGRA